MRSVRKVCFLFLLIFSVSASFAQNQINKWGVFEITLEGNNTGNPFIDTQLSAEFKHGDKTYNPEGFYDGNGIYKIRFMPDEEGVWTYTTSSNDKKLDRKKGEFICMAALPNVHGPVKVSRKVHFAYEDNKNRE